LRLKPSPGCKFTGFCPAVQRYFGSAKTRKNSYQPSGNAGLVNPAYPRPFAPAPLSFGGRVTNTRFFYGVFRRFRDPKIRKHLRLVFRRQAAENGNYLLSHVCHSNPAPFIKKSLLLYLFFNISQGFSVNFR
jgi:hypothetical protein